MNKLSLPLTILTLAFSVFTYLNLKSSSEQVYVDVNKLLEGYERTAIERKAFEEKSNELKANLDSLVTDWQNELKTYEKERTALSKKELELKQQLLVTQQQQIENYQQAVQKQIREEDKKVTQTVINDINDYVKEYGAENGYTIILGASGSGNIMYAAEGTDLTDQVLEGLNNEFNGK